MLVVRIIIYTPSVSTERAYSLVCVMSPAASNEGVVTAVSQRGVRGGVECEVTYDKMTASFTTKIRSSGLLVFQLP